MDRMRVALMVTCVNDAMFPDTGKAVVAAAAHGSASRSTSRQAQTCCGQMHVNTGYLDEAVPVVRTFVDAFAGYDAIVAPSGSCAGLGPPPARDRGPPRRVTAGSRPRWRRRRPGSTSCSEFLVDVLGVTDVGAYFPHRVTYHPTCHSLRMLRRRRPAAAAAAGGPRASG